MKKIKTINKLLSSLTLLSPLSTVGFNNQYQNTQKLLTENTKNYINSIQTEEVQMGNITVNVEVDTELGYKKITGYVSGAGQLTVSDDIDEIGYQAFNSGSSIYSLDLSNANKLKTIESRAFWAHKDLSGKITFPSSLTTIKNYAFSETNITSLDFSKATSLTTIEAGAFNRSLIQSNIVLPTSLQSIGDYAFFDNNIHSLDFSKCTDLNQIGKIAFGNCKNLNFIYPNKNFSFATNLGTNANILIQGTEGIWKDDTVCAGSLGYGDIVIPSNIKQINSYAFSGVDIRSVDLSNATSLTTIGEYAFSSCDNFVDLICPDSLESINVNAFYDCKELTNVVLSKSLKSLGRYSFGSNYLNNLTFTSETPPTFSENWKPAYVANKIYVPSEQAKQAYLAAPNFGFSQEQIEIGLPPEPSQKKSNTGLIIGLIFGLGIPILAAVGFGIWYYVKKKNLKSKK